MADRHLVISLENIDHTLVAPVKHVPPHPLYPPVVNASHSSEVSSNEQALCRLIETDGRSFFSAVIQPDLAPCYILSPVELAGPDDERKQELITEIVRLSIFIPTLSEDSDRSFTRVSPRHREFCSYRPDLVQAPILLESNSSCVPMFSGQCCP